MGCTKWKVFQRVEQESINKRKDGSNKRKAGFPYWEEGGERNWKGFIKQIASSAAADGGVDGEGLSDSLTYWCLTRKFQTGPLTLHF